MLTDKFKETVFKELKITGFDITPELKANQVPGWNSLTHACVIAALERAYNIRLKNREILACANLGDLMELINTKLK